MTDEIKDEAVEKKVVDTEKVKETKETNTEEKRTYEQKKDFKRNPRNNREYNTRGDRDDYKFRRMRRKVCMLCKEKNYVLDYKDAETLNRFINEKAKILPRRATGTCAKHQREIAKVIKRARHIAVIPYTTD